MTREEMLKFGIYDYFLELKKYIYEFVDKNYPLTSDDLSAIIQDKETSNIKTRNEISKIMTSAMMICLEEQLKNNKQFLENLNQKQSVKAITVEEERKLIFEIKQQMLAMLWEYTQVKENNNERKSSAIKK